MVDSERWTDTIHSHDVWDEDGYLMAGRNGALEGIPAGYTYLWQISLHDVSHTSIPITGLSTNRHPIINSRSVGLNLESIFGGGPAVCPRAYVQKRPAGSKALVGSDLKIIRGPGCAEFDIVRYRSKDDDEWNEAHIADPRNEDNKIIGQLTGLIHAFHNCVLQSLGNLAEDAEQFENKEVIARAIVAFIFRRIVVQDLMSRLLDRRVFEFYATRESIDVWGYLDDGHSRNSVPVELAHAVGRIGHCMVRPKYNLRENADLFLQNVFTETATRDPVQASLTQSLKKFVDWRLFFPISSSQPDKFNWSAKFDLHTAAFLNDKNWFASSDELYDGTPSVQVQDDSSVVLQATDNPTGLIYRDFVRGASVGNRSIPSIAGKLDEVIGDREIEQNGERHPLREALEELLDASQRKQIVLAGLNSLIEKAGGEPTGSLHPRKISGKRIFRFDSSGELVNSDQTPAGGTQETELDIIANDPPLLLYCICEAREARGGRLGPLASVILAETFFGAFDHRQGEQSDVISQWNDDVRKEARKVFPEKVYPRLPASMSDLIRIVKQDMAPPNGSSSG